MLPPELEANEPPEVRGRSRDHVRLLVAAGDGSVLHTRFTDLPDGPARDDVLERCRGHPTPAAVCLG